MEKEFVTGISSGVVLAITKELEARVHGKVSSGWRKRN